MTTERENARDLGDRDRISSDTWEKVTETLHQENKSAMQDSVEISSRKNDIPVDQQQQVSSGGSVNDPKDDPSETQQGPESSSPVIVISPNDSDASNLKTNEDDANAVPVDVEPKEKKQGPKKNAATSAKMAAEETKDVAEKQQGPKKKAARIDNAAKKENNGVQSNLPKGGSNTKANVSVQENEYALASGKLNFSQTQEEVMNTSITAANQSGHIANRPLGLPIYAWGVIGVGLVLGVVLGALAARKRRRRKSASIGPTSTSTKKRIAIDYGDDDSVDVEELSIESDISSLSGQWSGGTFVVRQDRV